MTPSLTLPAYRRMRRIYLRVARSYRTDGPWGPACPAAVRAEQLNMAAIRRALRGAL